MIAKKYKLPVQESYGRKGRTKRDGRFLLKIFPPGKSYPRFGVVISRKVAAKATARNQLKRLVFNFVRKYFDQLPINDYLLIFYPSTTVLTENELSLALTRLFDIKNAKQD